jgi:hypothetical protein
MSSLIGKYLYDVQSCDINLDDYVIAPANYKFNVMAKKMNMLKDVVKNDQTTISPDSFKKIGKIVDIKTFYTYKYNIAFNAMEIDIQPYYDTTILLVENNRKTIKYFEIYRGEKFPYHNGDVLTWLAANEYSKLDVIKNYTPFDFENVMFNDSFANYFVDMRNPNSGYCFEGKVTIPINDESYSEFIDIVYNPSNTKKSMMYEDYDYTIHTGFNMSKMLIVNLQNKYINYIKSILYNHIIEYFETIKQEQIITIENITHKLKNCC